MGNIVLLEYHEHRSASLVALGVDGAVRVEFELAFTAARAADDRLRRIGCHDGGLMSVVHGHGEDGQHESGISMGMLRADDGQRVYLSASADLGKTHVGGAER